MTDIEPQSSKIKFVFVEWEVDRHLLGRQDNFRRPVLLSKKKHGAPKVTKFLAPWVNLPKQGFFWGPACDQRDWRLG